jgi:hypothetical protein
MDDIKLLQRIGWLERKVAPTTTYRNWRSGGLLGLVYHCVLLPRSMGLHCMGHSSDDLCRAISRHAMVRVSRCPGSHIKWRFEMKWRNAQR